MLNEPNNDSRRSGSDPVPPLAEIFAPELQREHDICAAESARHVIEGVRPARSGLMDAQRISELHALHVEGLRAIEGIRTWRAKELTAGLEVEMQLVNLSGSPSGDCLEVSRQVSRSAYSVVPECGRHVIEVNSSVKRMGGAFLREYEMELRQALDAIGDVSELSGREVCLTGTQPSMREAEVSVAGVTPKDRYLALVEALATLKKECASAAEYEFEAETGKGKILIENDRLEISADGRTFSISTPGGTVLSATIQSLMTSIQFHWSVLDIEQYVASHRLADLMSSITVAAGANSPIALGSATGLKASRIPLWAACAHPDRAGLGSRWISDPFEQLRDALSEAPVARPILEPSVGKTQASMDSRVRALIEHAKTHWPMNRTTLGLADGMQSGTLRIEHRPVCTASTVVDNIANAALFYGLMAGMPDHLRVRYGLDLGAPVDELEKRIPFESVRRSFVNALARGLQASVEWIDGDVRVAGELLKNELLPVARRGLGKLGVPREDIDRYLGIIERRAAAERENGGEGVTGADIQLSLWRSLDHLDSEERGKAIVRLLCQARAEDTFERPQDIVTWYRKNFGV